MVVQITTFWEHPVSHELRPDAMSQTHEAAATWVREFVADTLKDHQQRVRDCFLSDEALPHRPEASEHGGRFRSLGAADWPQADAD